MSTFPGERCQHKKMNGERCGSPAQRNQKVCYFHEQCYPVIVDVSTSPRFPASPFYLPVLEDENSIQATITQVCEHLLGNRLDPKTAGVLLYAMQVATSSLNRPRHAQSRGENNDESNNESRDDSRQTSAENNQQNGPQEAPAGKSSPAPDNPEATSAADI